MSDVDEVIDIPEVQAKEAGGRGVAVDRLLLGDLEQRVMVRVNSLQCPRFG